MISSPMVDTSVSKTMLGITVKLNGSDYLLWTQAFRIFIGAQNKLAHLLQLSHADTDPTYVTWLISGSVIFLSIAKDMWDILKVMYENEKNPSRVFEIYERMVELK